jgi:type VI secretion system secreted protein Hcp
MKDIYIKFINSKIIGDVRDKVHSSGSTNAKNNNPVIEVESWSHIIKQPKSATASTAGGHTSERCEHGEMIFVKDIDSASPKMWQAASMGLVTPEVEISFFRASGQTTAIESTTKNSRVEYLKIKLKNVLISSVAPTVSEEGIPKETFGLKYSAVDWAYKASTLNGVEGVVTGTGSWNLATNTAAFGD